MTGASERVIQDWKGEVGQVRKHEVSVGDTIHWRGSPTLVGGDAISTGSQGLKGRVSGMQCRLDRKAKNRAIWEENVVPVSRCV